MMRFKAPQIMQFQKLWKEQQISAVRIVNSTSKQNQIFLQMLQPFFTAFKLDVSFTNQNFALSNLKCTLKKSFFNVKS